MKRLKDWEHALISRRHNLTLAFPFCMFFFLIIIILTYPLKKHLAYRCSE